MEEKSSPEKPKIKGKINRLEKIIEISTWIVIIAIIFGVQIIPNRDVDNTKAYLLIGTIVAFALFYYLIIYKYFSRSKRLYLKEIADIILIGSLILILKDWGQYFYALFFLPIAAAALSLEFINALLIAAVASLFVIFEIFMGAEGMYPQGGSISQGVWQVSLIILITVFCRILAMQIREERSAKEESLARQKVLQEESSRQKEFLSLTSHQLYTPLSMIRGFASMLDDGTLGKLTSQQQDAAGEIYRNSKRMAALVDELLSISRIQAGTFEIKKEKVKIEDLIAEIVSEFQKALPKKNVILVFSKPTGLPEISIDKDKIRQVICILLDNSIKYTPAGKVTISCRKKNDTLDVLVKDEGVGLKQEDFDKLFEPFFRGKNILELDNKGTGLGLYIARLLVEKHGGKIWAEPPGDKGATFTFSLPMI